MVRRRQLPPHLDREDLIGAALIALVQAADQFDERRGVKFSTWAIAKMRGAVLEYLREADWLPRLSREKVKRGEAEEIRVLSLDTLLRPTGESGESWLHQIPDLASLPSERAMHSDLRARLNRCLSSLPERERRAVERYFFGDVTFLEISREMQISESRAYQLVDQAKGRLRIMMEGEEWTV